MTAGNRLGRVQSFGGVVLFSASQIVNSRVVRTHENIAVYLVRPCDGGPACLGCGSTRRKDLEPSDWRRELFPRARGRRLQGPWAGWRYGLREVGIPG